MNDSEVSGDECSRAVRICGENHSRERSENKDAGVAAERVKGEFFAKFKGVASGLIFELLEMTVVGRLTDAFCRLNDC